MGGGQLLHQREPPPPQDLWASSPCSANLLPDISVRWMERARAPRGGAPSFTPSTPNSRMASYLMKPRNISSTRLTSHPAVAKALGMVSAPVPTMRLNIYTSPTWNRERQHLSSPEIDKPHHPQQLPRVTLGYDKTRGNQEAQEALARRARKKGGFLSGSREAGSAAGRWATKARGPSVFSKSLWGSVLPSSFESSPPSLHQCIVFGAAS